jgi:hypothetical protein
MDTAKPSPIEGNDQPSSNNRVRTFTLETFIEGKKEFAKRIVQGTFWLVALLITFILTLLVSAYFYLLEPRLARHIATIITTESYFIPAKGSTYANPIDDHILKVVTRDSPKGSTSSNQIEDYIYKIVTKDPPKGSTSSNPIEDYIYKIVTKDPPKGSASSNPIEDYIYKIVTRDPPKGGTSANPIEDYIYKIVTRDVPKGSKYSNPMDDYILKVFLREIASEKASNTEASKIIAAVNEGQSREGFRIFSRLIGQEIDTLGQIKVAYQRPTTVQFGPVNVRVSDDPKYDSRPFSVLVSRGQILEVLATDLKVNFLASNSQDQNDPAFKPITVTIKCTGCTRKLIEYPDIRNANDFGRKNLTGEIDWSSGGGSSEVKHIELEIVPKGDEQTNYVFSGRFVVLVLNALPQMKDSK